MVAADARRHPSVSNLNSRHRSASRLTSGSNPSLESQLAYDFQRHASVANPQPISSGSASSLGRYGSSQFSLHGDIPPVPPVPAFHGGGGGIEGGRGSAPPSAYGHPAQAAVSSGVGMGRHVLPTIQGWEEGDVNPMFRVVSPVTHLSRVNRKRLTWNSHLHMDSKTKDTEATPRSHPFQRSHQ